MKAFAAIYGFELKKILRKKYILILLAIMVGAVIYMNIFPLFETVDVAYVDESKGFVFETVSRYEEIQLDRRFAKEDSGKLLDNAAAQPMREMNRKYQEIYNTYEPELSCVLKNHYLVFTSLANLTVNPMAEKVPHIADFAYMCMKQRQVREYINQSLTNEEKAYWDEKRGKIDIPFTLEYSEGYTEILEKAFWLNMMSFVFALIALCAIFSEDYGYHVRPILICAKYGHWPQNLAKLAAGETVAAGGVLVLFGLTCLIQFFVHGTDGFGTPIQMLSISFLCESSWPITGGEALWLFVGISMLLALFAGAAAMFLSKLFRKAVPALALPMGLLMLSLGFSERFYGGLWSQISSYFPIHRLSVDFLKDEHLVMVGGVMLDCVSVTIVIYAGLTVIFLALCICLCHRQWTDRK